MEEGRKGDRQTDAHRQSISQSSRQIDREREMEREDEREKDRPRKVKSSCLDRPTVRRTKTDANNSVQDTETPLTWTQLLRHRENREQRTKNREQ